MTFKKVFFRTAFAVIAVLACLAFIDVMRYGWSGEGDAPIATEEAKLTDADRFADAFGEYPDGISGADVYAKLVNQAKAFEKTKGLRKAELDQARALHNGLPPNLQPTDEELKEQFKDNFENIENSIQKALGDFTYNRNLALRFGFEAPPTPTL